MSTVASAAAFLSTADRMPAAAVLMSESAVCTAASVSLILAAEVSKPSSVVRCSVRDACTSLTDCKSCGRVTASAPSPPSMDFSSSAKFFSSSASSSACSIRTALVMWYFSFSSSKKMQSSMCPVSGSRARMAMYSSEYCTSARETGALWTSVMACVATLRAALPVLVTTRPASADIATPQ